MRAEDVIGAHYISGMSTDVPLCTCGKEWEPFHVITELSNAGYVVKPTAQAAEEEDAYERYASEREVETCCQGRNINCGHHYGIQS